MLRPLSPPRTYRLFGLTVTSELELDDVELGSGEPDAIIRLGSTPECLAAPTVSGIRWQASPGQVLVTLADIARIHIIAGREIVVTPFSAASTHDVAYAIMRAAIGSLLHQRHVLVLHASAVRLREDRAVAVAGPSTSGKSTVLFACLQRGWGMITDDIAALEIPPAGEVRISPGNPVVSLWRDALDHFAVDATNLQLVRSRVDKFKWPAPAAPARSAPLSAVVVLERSQSRAVHCERLHGKRAFAALRANVRGLQVAEAQHLPGTFQRIAAAADRVPVFSISRPDADITAARTIVDLIAAIAENPRQFAPPVVSVVRRAPQRAGVVVFGTQE